MLAANISLWEFVMLSLHLYLFWKEIQVKSTENVYHMETTNVLPLYFLEPVYFLIYYARHWNHHTQISPSLGKYI